MRVPAFLLFLLISILWESGAYGRGSTQTWIPAATTPPAPSCTLDVVLVTFDDATTPAGGYDYHEHDRPYGTNPGQDMGDRYTLRDFERLFIGGYESLQDLPFVGDTVHVANGRYRLPYKVFGSVRAYYDSVSNGAFQLHVRMINPADDQGYPRWVELPRTKAHYAEIDLDDFNPRTDDPTRIRNNWFREDAYAAAWDSVRCWNPYPDSDPSTCGASVGGYTIDELPNGSYSDDRLIRRKILYLYSGAIYSARSPAGLLHPHAGRTDVDGTGSPTSVGYRYVMGEREGWGHNDHDIDEFAGIFTHAHEIGHMLGLRHPGGQWGDPNPYTGLPSTNSNTANLMDWGLMQGAGAGPRQTDESDLERLYHRAYRSCPNPINPFYRMDLGWLNPTDITESRDNYVIEPGTVHRITRLTNPGGDEVEYLLERRTHDGMENNGMGGRSFGRYVSYHEYENTDPGLFIWRRHSNEERPMLIVADDRRIGNARDQDWSPTIPEYQDMLYDPFPVEANTVWTMVSGSLHTFVQAAVDSVDSHMGGIGLRQTTLDAANGDDEGEQPDPGDVGLAITEITRTNDTITVDIHMAPPGPPTNLTVVASNGQATLSWRPPVPAVSGLPRPPPPSYEYQQSIDGGNNWGSAIAVAEGSTDARSQTINGIVNSSDYAFAVRAVNPVGSSDWVHIRPLVLAGPTAIEFPEVVAPEAGRRMVANYTATDPENEPIEWSLEGADEDDFLLSPNGQLTFGIDPDFEEPTDRNHPPGQDPPTDPDGIYQVTVQARAGQQLATLDVAVTVTNADDPGTVPLSPLPPQAGVQLTATLMDQDDGVTEAEWTWQRQAPGTTTWPDLPTTSEITSGETQSSYTPQQDTDVGHSLRVQVSYQDGESTDETDEKNAHSAVTAAVIGVPDALESLVAAAGDQSVELTWEAPANNGGTDITDYKYRYRLDSGMTWEPPQDEDEDKEGTSLGETPPPPDMPHTVGGLTNGETYVFEVWAVNAQGDGPALTAEVTLNSAPRISGFESVSFDENGTGTIATYTATDAAGDAIEWSLSGRDARAFRFTPDYIDPNTIALSFQSAPNYEHPVDLPPTNNVYEVTVVADDDGTPPLAMNYPVMVTVVNVDEDGTVVLSPLVPQVGVPLTAELTDPDGGITGAEWQWQGQEPGETTWQTLSGTSAARSSSPAGSSPPYPELSSYTPQAAQVDWALRAVANHYRDVFGAGKRAHSDPTAPVQVGVPTAPQKLTATEGDESVTLTWEAPTSDGG